MKVVTGGQMAAIDKEAIEELGIPGVVLMEKAGMQVCKAVNDNLESIENSRVVILAGRGNNGGDGFVVSRLLAQQEVKVETYLLGREEDISGDAEVNLDIIKKLGITMEEITAKEQVINLQNKLETADLIVDALLGTGIKGELRGFYPDLIDLVNQVSTKVIVVDIPSGVEADSGKVRTTAVRAEETVTFALPKLGLILYPGAEFVGKLKVVDIGIPEEIITEQQGEIELITDQLASSLLPKRRENSHKGDYGRLLLVAGSTGMTGAAFLAGQASLRIGAGLVTVGTPGSLNFVLEEKLTEAMTYPLPEQNGLLSVEAKKRIEELMNSKDVLAIGPGLRSEKGITEIIHYLLKKLAKPMVIDADGLNALENLELLKEREEPAILTPHPGELARLIDKSIAEIQVNRVETAREFAVNYQCCLVLKGARTVVAAPDGRIYLNKTGNSGLATGGSGDVLTGLIAGLLAQDLNSVKAAVLGVYLHGKAADLGVKDLTEYSFLPKDLLDYLPTVINDLLK